MTRHATAVSAHIPPRVHDASYAPRWRFADRLKRVKGCPLRQDYDRTGHLRQIACLDLKGTMGSCAECKR